MIISIFNELMVFDDCTGSEPGTQYVYRYVGRVSTGIAMIKDDSAAMEVECRVVLQSVDVGTSVVQVRQLSC